MKNKTVVGFSALTFGILFAILVQPFALATQLGKTPVTKVNVNDTYSMNIPTYMVSDSSLNDESSLHYGNNEKELYIIVIDEPIKDFVDVFKERGQYDTTKTPLENYADAQMESIISNLDTLISVSPLRKAKLGKTKNKAENALISDVVCTQQGIDERMSFTIGFVEGKVNLYMIMTWTLTSRWALYEKDMNNMVLSFREY
jgi:hypothetical protein